ncbi:DUF4910 domain-containing protein [Vibrio breoganii]|uniref:DUF4910 domain-containing protein n=1 Tax=Vibrio breoganii TaxID=553239 RepID=UPI000C81A321|nr:DUF4910 domain-containing protein [Vibrio breoganii]PMO91532.1 aminopeptidase [Vibrio breoganii]
MKLDDVGLFCHRLAQELFPICRSLTGAGVRETLSILQRELPDLNIRSVPSGAHAFDWVVPPEWNIKEAYIEDESGNRVIDFVSNNLHLVGYSTAVDKIVSLEELQGHLYSIPEQPNAIPYVTSYYSERWGFCLTHEQREQLKDERYRVVIDSDHRKGHLNYAELLIKGQTSEEIFISTYVCHPSMANNELSGPVVTTALCKWLASRDNYYSYRIVFVPETIGSIVYLSRNLSELKTNVIAGFNVSCVGDDRAYSYLPSREGETLSDRAAVNALSSIDPLFKRYTWLDRGSDERQYCAPGVDLPIATIMRSKYGEYPEYHTSLDDLTLVTPSGLAGGYNAIRKAISILERNTFLKVTVLGEPQLGKRGLYPNTSVKHGAEKVRDMMNLISYCDGKMTLLDICEFLNKDFDYLYELLSPLLNEGLVASSRLEF